ncbi:lipid IV(A) 3-deoxy-D-manno-octulosonic acid transferase [Silvimonas iriomotensis]|uniref:3-deoxy-D-manno-octulosonic acid transferase n=1 Tax=Silvimonas iriomotensis TaxID=449662 RepID=A0ABQ2PBX9_9NEIS|nr:lipid IV(A) 3-deoxy-D-manno-octulosonic acid transferase [Silvimonas iriomotensis]GGP23038.1 3-deoxy-D-manno-octulosonic acid transferase [Silvimonas iriomotensis]
MIRVLYSALLWLVTPLVMLYLWRRSLKQPDYRKHWNERWGYYGKRTRSAQSTIWLHAVSVGEVRAAAPLIKSLKEAWPDHRVLLTCMTPTGRATAQELLGDTVTIAYLPYDYAGATRRFIRQFKPVFGLLMETEIWPNLVAVCRTRRVPLFLVNARLSAKSAAGYQRWHWLASPAFAGLTATFAQSEADAARISALGAQHVLVTGNVKFDFDPPTAKVALGKEWRNALGQRPVLLFASSREGEEALLLDALARHPLPARTLLVIVPRHPQRFDEVAALISARGLHGLRRSEWNGQDIGDAQVLLGDSMGELAAWYTLADVAIIGGSLLPFGSQNLIESCAVGTPVVIGPSTFNFAEAARMAIESGATLQGADADKVAQLAIGLLQDETARHSASVAGLHFASAHRGATGRVLGELAQRLSHTAPPTGSTPPAH